MCTNTKLVFTDRVTFYCAIIFIFLNGHTEQFSDRMAMKPKMDTVCTLLGFVGRGLPVFPMPSRCFPMPSRCFPMPSWCPMLSDAFPTPYRCFPMLSRLLSNAFPMPSDARLECLPNTFPMPRRSLPHIIPFKSLPNSFAWIPSQLFFFPTPSCLKIRHRKDIGKASGSIPSEPIGTSKLQLLRVPRRPNIGKASERRRKEWV